MIQRLNAALSGRYRVERELGEGGMATVYLAEDLRHRRKVAVKVLKPRLAAAVGVDRFLAEIETTAKLQHPNILPLFDSGEAEGLVFFVMPWVEGETIRDRLEREEQLPVDEAVRIAVDVAEALDYAHRHGVIHRDIKPANILLREGRPLVADFGIALAATRSAAGERLTGTGASLGTPHYMSPEQATGSHGVTPATDVYALGCVLYEMLTGSPPYAGPTPQAVLASIVTGATDPVSERRRRVPANVDGAVCRAIETLPADRFPSAADFAKALTDPGFRYGAGAAEADRGVWRRVAVATTVLAVASLTGAVWALARGGGEIRDLGLPHDAPMRMETFRAFAVEPEGSFAIYEAKVGATTQLWYRSLEGPEARPLRGTEGAFGTPRISPDGSRVAFASGGELKVVPIGGGPVVTVAEVQDPFGGGWLEDGLVFFSDEDGRYLRWIDAATGPVRRIDADYCIEPRLLDDGERVLCGGGGRKVAYARELDRPMEPRYLRAAEGDGRAGGGAIRGSDFRVVDANYLVYMSVEGALMGTRIEDPASLTVGRSIPLVPSVRREAYSGAGQFDLTPDGSLVYVPGPNADIVQFVRFIVGGRSETLSIESAAHLRFAVSPDGRRIVTVSERSEGQQLRVYGLDGEMVHTLDESYKIGQPRWSPDGGHLVYTRWENPWDESLVRLSLSSARGPEVMLRGDPGLDLWPASYVSEDLLLLGTGGPPWPTIVMDPTRTPPAIDSLELSSLFVSLSADRRWLAYQNPGGEDGLQIQPWPVGDRRHLVDPDGNDPRWISDTELAYWATMTAGSGERSSGVAFYRVRMDPAADPPVGPTELLVTDPRFADTPGPSVDVTPDGDLIYLRSSAENAAHYLRVVPGWVEEMKRAVDAANRLTP